MLFLYFIFYCFTSYTKNINLNSKKPAYMPVFFLMLGFRFLVEDLFDP